MGVLEVLQIIFIILKLTKTVNWSWKQVLIPLWISIGITAVSIVFAIFVELIAVLGSLV